MINILQIAKRYAGNYPLLNEMVRLDPDRFRTVVCYLSGKNDGENRMDELAARTVYLDCPGRHLRLHNLPLLKRLRQIIEEENIHIVNCQLHRTTPLGVAASMVARHRPLALSSIHGLGGSRSKKRKLQNLFLHKKIHRIVCVSHAVRNDILAHNHGLSSEKLVTIQNGLNFDKVQPRKGKDEIRRRLFPEIEADFWFGTAGRLSAVKNHYVLLHAFRRVVDRAPGAVLLIAGKGELEAELRELARSMGLAEKVRFLGFRTDIPEILQALDAFVMPSLREGLPLALLEAMASGLPAIASNVGGIPEVFSDRPMGVLVDPGEAKSVAEGMLEMVRLSPEQLVQQGENARARALKDFSAERMIQDYQNLYEECYRHWMQQRKQ